MFCQEKRKNAPGVFSERAFPLSKQKGIFESAITNISHNSVS